MRNKVFLRIIIGFILGAIIGNLIALFTNNFKIVAVEFEESVGIVWAVILQTLFSGLMGMSGIGGMSVYEKEEWGLLKATLIHYLMILIADLLSFFILKWLPFTFINFLIIFGVCTITFFIIWLIMYLRWKKIVKEMNEDLDTYKNNLND